MIENCKYCSTEHPQSQCPAYDKMCTSCSKANHFNAVYSLTQRQQQGQRSLTGSKSVHEVQQDEVPCPIVIKHDRSFTSIKIKYLNFDSVTK